MSGISVPEFLDVLKPQLEVRSDLLALSPVPTVYTAWPTIDFSITDSIILGFSGRSTREPAAVGRNRLDESPVLDSQVRIMRAGAGEVVVKAARDRAKTIVASVDNELRTNHPELAGANDDVLWSRVGTYEFAQFPAPAGGDPDVPLRVFVMDFEILYVARVDV